MRKAPKRGRLVTRTSTSPLSWSHLQTFPDRDVLRICSRFKSPTVLTAEPRAQNSRPNNVPFVAHLRGGCGMARFALHVPPIITSRCVLGRTLTACEYGLHRFALDHSNTAFCRPVSRRIFADRLARPFRKTPSFLCFFRYFWARSQRRLAFPLHVGLTLPILTLKTVLPLPPRGLPQVGPSNPISTRTAELLNSRLARAPVD